MTLQQLAYFKAIADIGSYTVAAQTLNVSQSVVSRAIADLEKELEVPLLIRSRGKKVQLSDYGKSFLAHTNQVFASIRSAREEIEIKKDHPATVPVALAFSYFTAMPILGEILRCVDLASYPEKIDLQPLLNQEDPSFFSRLLLSGEADLAITAFPPDKKIEGTCIARQELVLLVNRSNPLARHQRVTIQDLSTEPLIGCSEQNSPCMEAVRAMFARETLTPHFVSLPPSAGTWIEQVSLTALGRGSCIVPRMAANVREASLVAVLTLADPLAIRSIYLVWPKGKKLSPAVEFVRKAILEYCSLNPVLDALG